MMRLWANYGQTTVFILVIGLTLFSFVGYANADLYLNILAVNGTEQLKDKEINFHLPKELNREDILDTAGLQLDYDVNAESYYVYGSVQLQPKETKTYKIRIRDVWVIDQQDVEDIKKEINASMDRIKNTEYFDTGVIKKQSLEDRLNFIVRQQQESADNVERRIDRYRTYANELHEIRQNAISVKYWRSKPPTIDEAKIFRFIVEVENPYDDKEQAASPKHFLPTEVKPEHLVEIADFEVRYDPEKGQSYLTKEEKLQPGENKRYTIGIIDIWNIAQESIEDLKNRTRKAYELLENTEYVDSAGYLVANIKEKLAKVEESQTQEKGIREHISAFRTNSERFESAKTDVETLEDLLEAVRENLERSPMKNVLQRIKALKSVADIAEAIFGTKPSRNNAWKIITAVMIFVGIFTAIHFAIWGQRSKDVKITESQQDKKASPEAEKQKKA